MNENLRKMGGYAVVLIKSVVLVVCRKGNKKNGCRYRYRYCRIVENFPKVTRLVEVSLPRLREVNESFAAILIERYEVLILLLTG